MTFDDYRKQVLAKLDGSEDFKKVRQMTIGLIASPKAFDQATENIIDDGYSFGITVQQCFDGIVTAANMSLNDGLAAIQTKAVH